MTWPAILPVAPGLGYPEIAPGTCGRQDAGLGHLHREGMFEYNSDGRRHRAVRASSKRFRLTLEPVPTLRLIS
jgi:hypothetical protein